MRRIVLSLAGLLGLVVTFAVFAIFTPPASAPLPNEGSRYVLRNVRVLDVEAGSFGALTSIGIQDGLIASIGSSGTIPGARIIDGGGRYLVPGFWDMHVHSFQLSPQLHFPLFVANGVTNVRDMMDCPDETDGLIACVGDKRRWSAVIDDGQMAAPRFVEVASFYFNQPDMPPEEVLARARAYKARGINALKVYNRPLPKTYDALTRSADQLDMRLVGHLPKAVSLDTAVGAGQVSFEHAHLFLTQCFAGAAEWRAGKLDDLDPTLRTEMIVREFDAETCRKSMAAMRDAGAWFVPTHVTREEDARAAEGAFVNDPRLDYLDPLSRWAYRDDLSATVARHPGKRGSDALQAYFQRGLELTGEAHRAGVGILAGTDTAIGGFRYHDELVHLNRAGLSPAEVLRAATIDAARYAGLDATSGSIAVGKRADLVLLGANPLEDIRNTRKIDAVWLAGRLYDRRGLGGLLNFTRAQVQRPTNWVRLLWGFATSSVSSEL